MVYIPLPKVWEKEGDYAPQYLSLRYIPKSYPMCIQSSPVYSLRDGRIIRRDLALPSHLPAQECQECSTPTVIPLLEPHGVSLCTPAGQSCSGLAPQPGWWARCTREGKREKGCPYPLYTRVVWWDGPSSRTSPFTRFTVRHTFRCSHSSTPTVKRVISPHPVLLNGNVDESYSWAVLPPPYRIIGTFRHKPVRNEQKWQETQPEGPQREDQTLR